MKTKYFLLFPTLISFVSIGFGQTTLPSNQTTWNVLNEMQSNGSTIVDYTDYRTTAPEFNSNPEYINFIDGSSTSTGKFIPMKIRILDGPDTDNFGTTLTSLHISVEDLSDNSQLSMIKTAILTTSGGAVIATATKVGDELVFSGMGGPWVTAEDDNLSGKNLHIRVSLDETRVIDKTKLVFKITSATADPNGSLFATPDAGGAQSDTSPNDRNRLNVTADRLSFTTQPTTAFVGLGMFPEPVVSLTDLYGLIDLDITGSISVASTGTPSSHPDANIANGQAVLNAIEHSVPGGPFTLTASYSGWSVISAEFNIDDTASHSYRTTGSGDWTDNNPLPEIWEQYIGGFWVASSSPPHNSSAHVFIRNGHTLTSTSSFAENMTLIVLNGGTFNLNHNAVLGNLTIYDGGNVNVNENLAIKSSGILVVKDGGNLALNFKYENPSHSIWAGTEHFHPNSNLILKNWNESENLLPDNATITAHIYNAYNAVFGHIICDFEDNLNPNDRVDFLASGVTTNLAHGNLIFRSNTTENAEMNMSTTGSVNSGIGGDFHIEESYGDNQNINFNTSGTLDFTIKGSMILSTAYLSVSNGSGSNATVTIEGDLTIKSTATLDLNSIGTTASSAEINLNGNLSVAADGLLQNSNANQNGNLNFTGIGNGFTNETTQTIDIVSNHPNANRHLNFNIKNHANVKLINQDFRLGRNSGLTVEAGGTLDFGFNNTTALNVAISGTQTGTRFVSLEGSILKISSPDGLSKTGAIGNVRTTVSHRTFHQSATFYYVGKQNQHTGDGLSTGSTKKNVYINLEDDLLELRLTNAVGISDGGKLEIQRGVVIGERVGVNNLDFHGPNGQLVMTGGEYRISSITNNPLSEYLPLLRKYNNYSLTGGTINLNGNNATQVLSGTPTFYNLEFSGHNDLGNNYKSISKAVEVTNNITIADHAIVNVENKTFGGNAANLIMTDYARYITAGSGTKPDATGNYVLGPHTTIEFNSNSGAQDIRISNPVPSYANIVVSGSNVSTQSEGTGPNSFLQFQSQGSFRVTNSGTFKFKNRFGFSGTHNTAISNTNSPHITLEEFSTIEYFGADQNITTFNPGYQNLTISGAGTKTLGHAQDILINENLNLNSSTLLIKTDEAITVTESLNVHQSAHFTIENSGSLIQIDDTKLNVGKISMERKASIKHHDYVYWSSPINGYNVDNITETNHIYKWDPVATNPNNSQGNWLKATNEIMEIGRGYIVRAPNQHPAPATLGDLNFTATFYSPENGLGVPNNGLIGIEIKRGSNAQSEDDGDDNWNLIGNPYPSAISIKDFLEENEAIDGYVNLWKHGLPLDSAISPFYQDFSLNYHQADYFTYNESGNSDGPSFFEGYIAAGQGFMVNMVDGPESATATVLFKNNMRAKSHINSHFFKSSQIAASSKEQHRIWLDLISPTMPTNRILVGFTEGATMDKDRLYDAKINFDALTDGLYSLIKKESFIIQGRSLPFDDSDRIPLGLKVTKTENYTIAIAAVDGLFEKTSQSIYLKDHLNGNTHNLSKQPYSFNSESGTFNNRFELVFKDHPLSLDEMPVGTKQLSVIELSNGYVQFSVASNLSIKSVEIIDLLGRSLYHLKGNNATETYDLSYLSQAPYIAKVELSNGQIITKRSIKRH